MKKIFLLLLCMMMVCGCQLDYERDTSAGSMIEISVEEMVEKMENDETFVFLVSQSNCKGCQEFEAAMEVYLPNHHVDIYYLVYNRLKGEARKEALATIQDYFPSMTQTPSLYYVVNGLQKDQLLSGEEGLTKEKFDNWVYRWQIDKVVEE